MRGSATRASACLPARRNPAVVVAFRACVCVSVQGFVDASSRAQERACDCGHSVSRAAAASRSHSGGAAAAAAVEALLPSRRPLGAATEKSRGARRAARPPLLTQKKKRKRRTFLLPFGVLLRTPRAPQRRDIALSSSRRRGAAATQGSKKKKTGGRRRRRRTREGESKSRIRTRTRTQPRERLDERRQRPLGDEVGAHAALHHLPPAQSRPRQRDPPRFRDPAGAREEESRPHVREEPDGALWHRKGRRLGRDAKPAVDAQPGSAAHDDAVNQSDVRLFQSRNEVVELVLGFKKTKGDLGPSRGDGRRRSFHVAARAEGPFSAAAEQDGGDLRILRPTASTGGRGATTWSWWWRREKRVRLKGGF